LLWKGVHECAKEAEELLEIVMRRYQRGSTLTANRPIVRTGKTARDAQGHKGIVLRSTYSFSSTALNTLAWAPLSGAFATTSAKYKIEVHFAAGELRQKPSKDVALCLFLFTQEALANVVKHSHATSAHVELSLSTRQVLVCASPIMATVSTLLMAHLTPELD
jgi:signal transduction histidine kinase